MKDTLIDSYAEVVAKYPEKLALHFRDGHHFHELTFEQVWDYAQKLAVFLRNQGIKEGDRLVLISENRPEWVIADFASLILGTVMVPVHAVLASAQIAMIIEEIEPTAVFVGDRSILEKVLETETVKPQKYPIIYFETDLPADDPIVKKGRLFSFKNEVYDRKFEPEIEPVKHKPDRIVTIIYTSGTTGRFKGAVLSNQNFISNIEGVLAGVEVTSADKFLSVLPLSHVFERTVGYYLPLLCGSTISYVEDNTKLAHEAKNEHPTIIIAVPRLFEKVYQAVRDQASTNPFKNLILKLGLYIGKKYPKKSFTYKLADRIVFNQIKSAFGGQIRFFVSGAASLQQEIGQFFDALDIPVLEGYGLTETSPIIANNTLEHRRYGTVGQVLPNLKTKVVTGELYVKGPSIFKGYFKMPAKTKEAFAPGGWFKTGDLVEISKDGYVRFLAREKEILALSTGHKVSPALIEDKLELSPFIAQAFVFGDSRKHIAAVIVPEKSKVQGLTHKQLTTKIQAEADSYLNKYVAGYEQIRKFIIAKRSFTVANGLLTPTLKLRRKEILAKFEKEIDAIYAA